MTSLKKKEIEHPMEKMGKVKELLGQLKNIDAKIKRRVIIGGAVIIALAVILASVLNRTTYAVLFSGLDTSEASEIIGKLQDSGIAYEYNDGEILVDKDVVDETKAELVSEGYPKSGFTYDIYTENAGLMTTDSDKQTYKLYELQDRIGSTIRMFDGVKDAKVTIALGNDDQYVLSSDDSTSEASATATVIMEDGGSPTAAQAKAIQRLVSRSIEGMTFENVSVFDGNGIEVSADDSSSTTSDTSGNTSAQLSQIVENQITKNILNVLTPIYGAGNVKVSPKATINMEELVTQSTEYTTPEKINQNDKTGIVKSESGSGNSTSSSTSGGVTGTDSNSDVSQYNTDTGSSDTSGDASSSYYKEYLVNQIKKQGTIPPGVLDDLTVSVTINGRNYGSLKLVDLQKLIGNASGISAADRSKKIAVAAAPFYVAPSTTTTQTATLLDTLKKNIIPIGMGVGGLVVLLIILFMILKKKKKKGKVPVIEPEDSYEMPTPQPRPKRKEYNEEIINLQNEKGMELRKNIRDFSEKNPEISAQLLKNWLNGGSQDG